MDRTRPPGRHRRRGHELFAVLMAFAVALLVGRFVLAILSSPPAVLTIFVCVVAYIGAYVLFFQASRAYFGQ